MRLQILAVGKMKAGPDNELYARYADRIKKSGKVLGLNGPDLVEISESRKSNAQLRKAEEASSLGDRIFSGATIVLLDERGGDLSSGQFAEFLSSQQDKGSPALAFVIGGPDGHGQEIANRANKKIRLGAMTWPHQLARVMLAEQLYRAITILSGHPYHRE
ncbi:MAG: 23S rRNA (pseudouridine(1915)-N(3))-methyltransferase RlmH [Pseudomonadota bacterium]